MYPDSFRRPPTVSNTSLPCLLAKLLSEALANGEQPHSHLFKQPPTVSHASLPSFLAKLLSEALAKAESIGSELTQERRRADQLAAALQAIQASTHDASSTLPQPSVNLEITHLTTEVQARVEPSEHKEDEGQAKRAADTEGWDEPMADLDGRGALTQFTKPIPKNPSSSSFPAFSQPSLSLKRRPRTPGLEHASQPPSKRVRADSSDGVSSQPQQSPFILSGAVNLKAAEDLEPTQPLNRHQAESNSNKQTHVFTPILTGAPQKKSKFYGSGSTYSRSIGFDLTTQPAGGSSSVLPGSLTTGAASASLLPEAPYPAQNSQGQRTCRQCGKLGRCKEGRCVEKWGPSPWGSGTVCDRCRKKAKRIEKRGIHEQIQSSTRWQVYGAQPMSLSSTPLARMDTLPANVEQPTAQTIQRTTAQSEEGSAERNSRSLSPLSELEESDGEVAGEDDNELESEEEAV